MSKIEYIRKELRNVETGYGLMSLTWRPDPPAREQQHASMLKAVQLAKQFNRKAFFNAGEFYGPDNLTMIKEFFLKHPELREDVIISVKGGIDITKLAPAGKYEDVIKSVENSYKMIGGYIDIFEVARIDTSIVKEGEEYPKESFEALVEMIKKGRIGGISLSEVNEKQIRAIYKDWAQYMCCVEVELSLFSTTILKNGVAKACSDLGAIIICYSPLGRGLLTGSMKGQEAMPEGDIRKNLKRFHGDAFKQNMLLVKFLEEEVVLKRPANKPISIVQVALGWIKHWNGQPEFKGAKFIPIPSGSSPTKVEENFNDEKANITDAEFTTINDFLTGFTTSGDPYEHA